LSFFYTTHGFPLPPPPPHFLILRKLITEEGAVITRVEMKPLKLLLLLMLFSACLTQSERGAYLSKYPYGYKAAAVVTFDTEVVREGELEAIAAALQERGINATFFVVAGYFQNNAEMLEPLRSFEVASMAWSQPEWAHASKEERRQQIIRAHSWFEQHGYEVHGFRAPYLNATKSTLPLVAEMGYSYDSSLFYGFEPYEVEGVLEIPVSMNFDAFWDEEKMSFTLLPTYLAFQRAYDSGEVFTLLTHVDTASRNLQNFTAFLDYMNERRVWFPSARELAEWWRLRESLGLTVEGNTLILRNHASKPVKGATAVVDARTAKGAVETWRDPDSGKLYVVFPEVPPGGEARVIVE
jgi:peptidoglycan/xylan/chitin deacetylase (PgdA/CDA1 family)